MPLPLPAEGRLLVDPALPGPWNMAVDQVLLENADQGQACLRFYSWSEATVSLGYFQRFEERQAHAPSLHCPLVRRPSGGGALVHDNERHDLTYSLALPDVSRTSQIQRDLYKTFHQTLIGALSRFGISAHTWPVDLSRQAAKRFLCFQRQTPGDVMIGADKIGGSAQRRRASALLQHGTVLFDQSMAAPELPGIRQLAAVAVDPTDLREAWIRALSVVWPVRWKADELSNDERRRAEQKVDEKYGNDAWTRRR